MIQETTVTNWALFENIPQELAERPQWVVWKLEERGGRETKVPYDAKVTPDKKMRRASTTDLMTWATFDEAKAALESGRYDGIGFCFCSADPFVGIDFDHCRNPETEEVDPSILEYIKNFENRYVEVSVSGGGLHLITCGKIKGGTKKNGLEIYDQDRFFTMSGMVLDV
jgi:primase-polymerase (primpol)-like protein